MSLNISSLVAYKIIKFQILHPKSKRLLSLVWEGGVKGKHWVKDEKEERKKIFDKKEKRMKKELDWFTLVKE